eukprot:4719949-Prymnesium_polylepis.1
MASPWRDAGAAAGFAAAGRCPVAESCRHSSNSGSDAALGAGRLQSVAYSCEPCESEPPQRVGVHTAQDVKN